MRNKIISFFIIFGIFFSFYFYYFYYFKPKKQLKKSELNQIKEKKILEEKIKINLKKIEKQEKQEKILTKKEKSKILKQKKISIGIFKIENIGNFYFKKFENDIFLYFEDEKISSFKFVKNQNLRILPIFGNKDFLYIEVGNKKYIYSFKTKNIEKLNLNYEIEYLKIGNNNNEILIKTFVGTFSYFIKNKKLVYFNFFSDFIYYENGYLGIIDKEEETRLKNLGFDDKDKNLIVFYKPFSKEKNIIFETKLKLKKIYYFGEKIYFEDKLNEKYELQNFGKN